MSNQTGFYKLVARKKRDKAEQSQKVCQVDPKADLCSNFVEVFKVILCLWAWVKQDDFWKRGDTAYERYGTGAIRTLIEQLNNLIPFVDGRCWNGTKVHELLHIVHRKGTRLCLELLILSKLEVILAFIKCNQIVFR